MNFKLLQGSLLTYKGRTEVGGGRLKTSNRKREKFHDGGRMGQRSGAVIDLKWGYLFAGSGAQPDQCAGSYDGPYCGGPK